MPASPMGRVKVMSDGTPMGTVLLIDGVDAKLPVSSIVVRADHEGVVADVTLFCVELELTLDERQTTFAIARPGVPKEEVSKRRFFGEEPKP